MSHPDDLAYPLPARCYISALGLLAIGLAVLLGGPHAADAPAVALFAALCAAGELMQIEMFRSGRLSVLIAVSDMFLLVALALLPLDQAAAMVLLVAVASSFGPLRSWRQAANCMLGSLAAQAMPLATVVAFVQIVPAEPGTLLRLVPAVVGMVLYEMVVFPVGCRLLDPAFRIGDIDLHLLARLGFEVPLAVVAVVAGRTSMWAIPLLAAPYAFVWHSSRQARRLLDAQRDLAVDPLTQVFNRRGLWERALACLTQDATRGMPTCVVMCDVDHFKQLNDRHGHQAGDDVLRRTARAPEELADDHWTHAVVGRYGGEESMVVLPQAGVDEGRMVAELLRRGVEQALRDEHVTMSLGVAAGTAVDLDELVRRADAALYGAKRAGRNRVRVDEVGPCSNDDVLDLAACASLSRRAPGGSGSPSSRRRRRPGRRRAGPRGSRVPSHGRA